MLHNQATKEPTASGIFLDSWNGRLLDAGINGILPLVERVLLDMIVLLPSSSMGSVLSSIAAPQPLGSPSPWHWLAGLDFGGGSNYQ